MSYYCEISFKRIEADEVYKFFQKFKESVGEHMKEIVENNFTWVPYIRENESIPECFSDIPRAWLTDAELWATRGMFSFRYFYDKELKLLGVYSVHTCLQDMFDRTVGFQNSADQDYARNQWSGIPAFEEIFDRWAAKSDDEMVSHFNMNNSQTFEWECEEEDDAGRKAKLESYRRICCYKEIWARYEGTLYNDDSVVYVTLYGFYDTQHLRRFLKMCHDRYIEWNKEE